MSIKKHIPNTITCCNLLCGSIATGIAFRGGGSSESLLLAFGLIILGAVFDFFDGFAARLLHVSSAIGKELDSLADDITFGLAPATIVYSMLARLASDLPVCYSYVSYVAFLIAAFSALRLAKFNLDERQALGFIGLPTPANALLWGSIALAFGSHPEFCQAHSVVLFCAIVAGVFLSCWILVSEVPMLALKFKTYGWRGNEIRYSFIAVSALLLAALGLGGFAAVIVLYVIVSVFTQSKA